MTEDQSSVVETLGKSIWPVTASIYEQILTNMFTIRGKIIHGQFLKQILKPQIITKHTFKVKKHLPTNVENTNTH